MTLTNLAPKIQRKSQNRLPQCHSQVQVVLLDLLLQLRFREVAYVHERCIMDCHLLLLCLLDDVSLVMCHAGRFFSFSILCQLRPALPGSSLQHRYKLVHKIVVTQRKELLLSSAILMLFALSLWFSLPGRFVSLAFARVNSFALGVATAKNFFLPAFITSFLFWARGRLQG